MTKPSPGAIAHSANHQGKPTASHRRPAGCTVADRPEIGSVEAAGGADVTVAQVMRRREELEERPGRRRLPVEVVPRAEPLAAREAGRTEPTVTSYGPGDWYHVPAETEHAARFDVDGAEIEFWFSP